VILTSGRFGGCIYIMVMSIVLVHSSLTCNTRKNSCNKINVGYPVRRFCDGSDRHTYINGKEGRPVVFSLWGFLMHPSQLRVFGLAGSYLHNIVLNWWLQASFVGFFSLCQTNASIGRILSLLATHTLLNKFSLSLSPHCPCARYSFD
jgi:hypothetical protein